MSGRIETAGWYDAKIGEEDIDERHGPWLLAKSKFFLAYSTLHTWGGLNVRRPQQCISIEPEIPDLERDAHRA